MAIDSSFKQTGYDKSNQLPVNNKKIVNVNLNEIKKDENIVVSKTTTEINTTNKTVDSLNTKDNFKISKFEPQKNGLNFDSKLLNKNEKNINTAKDSHRIYPKEKENCQGKGANNPNANSTNSLTVVGVYDFDPSGPNISIALRPNNLNAWLSVYKKEVVNGTKESRNKLLQESVKVYFEDKTNQNLIIKDNTIIKDPAKDTKYDSFTGGIELGIRRNTKYVDSIQDMIRNNPLNSQEKEILLDLDKNTTDIDKNQGKMTLPKNNKNIYFIDEKGTTKKDFVNCCIDANFSGKNLLILSVLGIDLQKSGMKDGDSKHLIIDINGEKIKLNLIKKKPSINGASTWDIKCIK